MLHFRDRHVFVQDGGYLKVVFPRRWEINSSAKDILVVSLQNEQKLHGSVIKRFQEQTAETNKSRKN